MAIAIFKMRHNYPFTIKLYWHKHLLVDICNNSNSPFDWHELYISVPQIKIDIYPDWLDEPYASSYPDDNDDWDDIPF